MLDLLEVTLMFAVFVWPWKWHLLRNRYQRVVVCVANNYLNVDAASQRMLPQQLFASVTVRAGDGDYFFFAMDCCVCQRSCFGMHRQGVRVRAVGYALVDKARFC